MIRGVKELNNRRTLYSQENNPTEAYLKATINSRGGWLESCGPTSAVNCLASMGKNVRIRCPGVYEPQSEEVLMDYFNDPRNKVVLDRIRDDVKDTIPENRVPQFYPQAVNAVFGEVCNFHWGPTFRTVAAYVLGGQAVQLCLLDPGHYIAVVGYDDTTDVLIYNDSWGSRFADGKGGWHRGLGKSEFGANVQPYMIVYGL